MPAKNNQDVESPKQQRLQPGTRSNNHSSPVSAQRLKRLYSSMLQCRLMNDLSHKTRWHAVHGCGLEAIIAGSAVHLNAADLIAPSPYRALARMVKGAQLKDILADCRMKPRSGVRPHGSTVPADQFQFAAGMALACKLMKKDSVVLCLADADRDPGFWRDALAFSAGHQLPVVFVLAHTIEKYREGAVELRTQAAKLAPAITVDGNDAVAVSRVAEESTRRAREGLGPSLLECLLERRRDPLLFMESYLKQRTLWSEQWKQELVRRFTHDMSRAKSR